LANLLEEDLGMWRRTHYSADINPSLSEQQVIIMGWISSVRDHGNIKFIMINDRFGHIQIALKKKDCPNILLEKFEKLKEHSSVAVKGTVRSEAKAPNSAEIVPLELKILSFARKPSPFQMQSRKSVGIDTRLDLRALDLRRPLLQSIFNIRYTVLNSCREFLREEGFIEVNTPKIIATSTEGGATLFPIFYYDREAFMAQSPQLYKEQLTMAFENVFEIAPIFRAEPSRTNRHLSEAISIDVERAFVDYNDLMSLLEEMIVYVIDKIKENDKLHLKYLGSTLPEVTIPFPRYRYSELVEMMQSAGESVVWGDDLAFQKLQRVQDLNAKSFYFITNCPTAIKPFYVKPSNSQPRECESFDLMYKSLEVSSGSTRIRKKEELLDRMKKQGLNVEAFDYHLKVFDYGIPPHAGFGVGLERLMMSICNLENIRDTTLYPRDIDRLTP
jgi:nondiscriminating aspartyl-tRNA synthetase